MAVSFFRLLPDSSAVGKITHLDRRKEGTNVDSDTVKTSWPLETNNKIRLQYPSPKKRDIAYYVGYLNEYVMTQTNNIISLSKNPKQYESFKIKTSE